MANTEITGQLTRTEFANTPSGTKAKKIRILDGDGNLSSLIYILRTDPNLDEELHDAKQVAPGYFTETWNVTRK